MPPLAPLQPPLVAPGRCHAFGQLPLIRQAFRAFRFELRAAELRRRQPAHEGYFSMPPPPPLQSRQR